MNRFMLAALCALTSFNSGCKQHVVINTRPDVTDPDFVASISPTETQYVFLVEVKKVNKTARKTISSLPVTVDLALEDSSGKKINPDPNGSGDYSTTVDDTFEDIRRQPTGNVKGRVKLLAHKLRPGVYTVRPRVRLIEDGDDELRGPHGDMGSVAIPAGNSVTVTVR